MVSLFPFGIIFCAYLSQRFLLHFFSTISKLFIYFKNMYTYITILLMKSYYSTNFPFKMFQLTVINDQQDKSYSIDSRYTDIYIIIFFSFVKLQKNPQSNQVFFIFYLYKKVHSLTIIPVIYFLEEILIFLTITVTKKTAIIIHIFL